MSDDGVSKKDAWDMICNLSELPKWGYERGMFGEKILAKKFEFQETTIYDFNIYRLENMIDRSWEDPTNAGTDAYILAEILEAYLREEVSLGWAEGFPMAYPCLDDFDLDDF